MEECWLGHLVQNKTNPRKRVLGRKYAQAFLDTKEFKGYITLLHVIKVAEPLSVQEKNICIVDDGYTWLQQFP